MAAPVPRVSLTALAPQARGRGGLGPGGLALFWMLPRGCFLDDVDSQWIPVKQTALPDATGLVRRGQGRLRTAWPKLSLHFHPRLWPPGHPLRVSHRTHSREPLGPVCMHTSCWVCFSGPGTALHVFPGVCGESPLSMAPRGPSRVEGPQPTWPPVALDRGHRRMRSSGYLHAAKTPGRVCPTPNDIVQTRSPPWARRWDLHPPRPTQAQGRCPPPVEGGSAGRRQTTDTEQRADSSRQDKEGPGRQARPPRSAQGPP